MSPLWGEDLNRFKRVELYRWASDLGIPGASRMVKERLINKVKTTFAALKIFLVWRSHKRHRQLAQAIDPITQLPVELPIFEYGPSRIIYGAATLIDYFLCSGCLIDPITRKRLLPTEVRQLNKLGATMGKQSLTPLMGKEGSDRRQEQRDVSSLLFNLECETGNYVERMTKALDQRSHRDAAQHIRTTLMPQFDQVICEMFVVDPQATKFTLGSWIALLRGDPLHPHDRYPDLLAECIQHLVYLEQEGQGFAYIESPPDSEEDEEYSEDDLDE